MKNIHKKIGILVNSLLLGLLKFNELLNIDWRNLTTLHDVLMSASQCTRQQLLGNSYFKGK